MKSYCQFLESSNFILQEGVDLSFTIKSIPFLYIRKHFWKLKWGKKLNYAHSMHFCLIITKKKFYSHLNVMLPPVLLSIFFKNENDSYYPVCVYINFWRYLQAISANMFVRKFVLIKEQRALHVEMHQFQGLRLR